VGGSVEVAHIRHVFDVAAEFAEASRDEVE
jgi:hypothetical protein